MTAAFILAYIFAIEYKPYGRTLGFYPGGFPLTFITYFSGLIGLSISGLWTSILGYLMLVKVNRMPHSCNSSSSSSSNCSGRNSTCSSSNSKSSSNSRWNATERCTGSS
jgi:hypothetical protein